MRKKPNSIPQLNLFLDQTAPSEVAATWPHPQRFPHNNKQDQVGKIVEQDLHYAKNPLLITGFTSLTYIIRFLANCAPNHESFTLVRIVIGHEPLLIQPKVFRQSFNKWEQDIADFWLNKGFSLYQSQQLLQAISFLEQPNIQIRTSAKRPIHAKIYCGDNAVILGSSNYSHAGMQTQIEGNIRLTADDPRFNEAIQLAEAIWETATDYLAPFKTLLNQLLQAVTWQDALARACSELLEGKWAKKSVLRNILSSETPLWPAQEAGIAQALWILEHVGSVLVADATGSDKTRLGVHMIRALMQHIIRTGRLRQDIPILFSPPLVISTWEREALRCGLSLMVRSQGKLSNTERYPDEGLLENLRCAQVLAIDEAHRFLNRDSQRTRSLYTSMADYIALFTATPINRGINDVINLIQLLGADNFDDDVLKVLEQAWKQPRANDYSWLDETAQQTLQQAIQRFTVRRTKVMFNDLVDKSPTQYLNKLGKPCRYPEHLSHVYACGETQDDRRLAQMIDEEAKKLRGLINLTSITFSHNDRIRGMSEESVLKLRLSAAPAIARYHIKSRLRSSRAAVLEHIEGTESLAQWNLPTNKKNISGNMIKKIQDFINHRTLPSTNLTIALPEWLIEPSAYEVVCREEISIYQRIRDLIHQMSDTREETKTKFLKNLLQEHKLVLAFDEHIITLLDIKQRLIKYNHTNVIVATGDAPNERNTLQTIFALGSNKQDIIALCSKAVSESISLQEASVVVHLNMPSVISIAEQRIGRIDRMDSLHQAIHIYWPDDSEEFALSNDEVFFGRHILNAKIFGSNMDLPPELLANPVPTRIVKPTDINDQVEQILSGEVSSGTLAIYDAFQPVRMLVQGEDPLIDPAKYLQMRGQTANVISSVSLVKSKSSWAFFAIKGSLLGAPRWVYMPSVESKPETNLDIISIALRQQLGTKPEQYAMDKTAVLLLKQFLDHVRQTESLLLPRKKQRALEEFDIILGKYELEARKLVDSERLSVIQAIRSLTKSNSTIAPDSQEDSYTFDLTSVADAWIDLIRPVWNDHLQNTRRNKRPLLLRDLRHTLVSKPLSTEQLREGFNHIPLIAPLDQRIVAAIVGIPIT